MQISSQKLKPRVRKQIFEQFYTLISDLRSPHESKVWVNDFMTKTERLVFAKRLAIAQMLVDDQSYQEIKRQLKVSSATISSVAEIISKDGMILAQDKIKLETWASKWVSLIINKLSLWPSKPLSYNSTYVVRK